MKILQESRPSSHDIDKLSLIFYSAMDGADALDGIEESDVYVQTVVEAAVLACGPLLLEWNDTDPRTFNNVHKAATKAVVAALDKLHIH